MTSIRFARVFWSPNAFEAHFVRTLLETHGIVAQVRNENLAPYVPAEVWVRSEDVEEASRIQRQLAGGELAIIESEEDEPETVPPESSCDQGDS